MRDDVEVVCRCKCSQVRYSRQSRVHVSVYFSDFGLYRLSEAIGSDKLCMTYLLVTSPAAAVLLLAACVCNLVR